MDNTDSTTDKGCEGIDKAYMHHCKEYTLRPSTKAQDGLNGSLPLRNRDINAIEARPGDTVCLYVEADGESLYTRRPIHKNGRAVTLPYKERRKLGLQEGDSVEFWIKLVEPERPKRDEQKRLSQDQKENSGEDEGTQYVWLVGRSTRYHRLDPESSLQTLCGLDFEDKNHKITSDPGGFLEECSNCAVQSLHEASLEDLARWLADEVGFELSGGPPSYLTKAQMVALREYILELKERAGER